MPASRLIRRTVVVIGATAIVATLGGPGPVALSAPDVSPGPHGAARVFKWGTAHWDDEFHSAKVRDQWKTKRPRDVENRFGMMTLKGRSDGREVRVTLRRETHKYGRWESRVRVRGFGDGRVPYRLTVELIPAGDRAYRCGARNITMAKFTRGDRRAHMAIRTLPNREFTFSRRQNHDQRVWNTYAVEITKDHISWFVDDKVVMTERRSAALSGVAYTVRYRFVATPKANRTPPYMQMDWSRYWTLKRPNAKSIKAPRSHAGTYDRAC